MGDANKEGCAVVNGNTAFIGWFIGALADTPNVSLITDGGPGSYMTSDDIETAISGLIADAQGKRLIATAGKGADVYELPRKVGAAVQALQELPDGPRWVFAVKNEDVSAFLSQSESRGVQLIDRTAVPDPA